MINIPVSFTSEEAIQPEYQSISASGMDLHANLSEELWMAPGTTHLVGTGIRLAIPQGYEGQVRPRSGLAIKYGITVLNAPGTVDSDYRGEIKVVLSNHGERGTAINHGDRIAQLVIAPIESVKLFVVDGLDDTMRSQYGFGSTGT